MSDKQKKAEENQTSVKPSEGAGNYGQLVAKTFLKHRGYEVLFVNWGCEKGEVDIIAKDDGCDDGCLVFVEVKSRFDNGNGLPEEVVTDKMRKRYEDIAIEFLKNSEFENINIRFDIVSVLILPKNRALIKHHINAWGEVK